jgi:Uma2 family endonuclease
MAVQREKVTLAEFHRLLAADPNRLLELIEGEIVEKMSTQEHGEIALLLGAAMQQHATKNKLGRVGVEVRHEKEGDDENSRLPDISFVSGIHPRIREGSVPQMPDLAVEIKSPDDSLKKLREKAHYYLANGTRMVLILDYFKKLIHVITPDDEDTLVEGETLTCGDVLPGFSMPVRDIFRDPLDE